MKINEIKNDKTLLTITKLTKNDIKNYNYGAKRINRVRSLKEKLPIIELSESKLTITMLGLHYWLYYEGMKSSDNDEFIFYSRLNTTQNIIKWSGEKDNIELQEY